MINFWTPKQKQSIFPAFWSSDSWKDFPNPWWTQVIILSPTNSTAGFITSLWITRASTRAWPGAQQRWQQYKRKVQNATEPCFFSDVSTCQWYSIISNFVWLIWCLYTIYMYTRCVFIWQITIEYPLYPLCHINYIYTLCYNYCSFSWQFIYYCMWWLFYCRYTHCVTSVILCETIYIQHSYLFNVCTVVDMTSTMIPTCALNPRRESFRPTAKRRLPSWNRRRHETNCWANGIWHPLVNSLLSGATAHL